MYKYLFGPVPSRRLGMSLGVDLIPHKICSFNCVYCECGHTTDLTNERKEYVFADEVKEELKHFFANNPSPDYITFSGAGEPTLNLKIGEVLAFIKSNWPKTPLAVLTNSSLLNNKQVRNELLNADIVLPSLDAASDETFRKINNSVQNIRMSDYIQGLVDFRNDFKGKIWLEVLILAGYNDNPKDLQLLKDAIVKIKPDSIQLNTLDRPGIINDLKSISRNRLQKIADDWGFDNIEIIGAASERKNTESYKNDFEDKIIETISRRPSTLNDLAKILGIHINEVNKYLSVLDEKNKIETIQQDRGLFYKLASKN